MESPEQEDKQKKTQKNVAQLYFPNRVFRPYCVVWIPFALT